MEKFQELLNIIKKYRICSDYDFDGHSLGNAHSGEIFEEKSIYTIISPELKKEARRLMLVSSELGGAELYRRTGREVDGKYWEYKRGDDNHPDVFELGKGFDKEKQRIREELSRNLPKPANNEIRIGNKSKDKCCFCNKKIDSSRPTITARGGGNEWFFCSFECSKSHNHNNNNSSLNDRKEINQEIKLNIKGNSKCSVCGITYDERKNSSWTQISFNEGPVEDFCGGCSKNRDKYWEINSEQNRLDELRSQIQKPENSSKKRELESEIKERENRLSKLKQESKNQQQKAQLQQEISQLE